MFGECTGKVRSTPTPNEILRTVKVSRMPPPCRRITTPLKICTRSREPSMTRTWTLRVSPGRKSGMSERSDLASRASRVFIGVPSSSGVLHSRSGQRATPRGPAWKGDRSACPGPGRSRQPVKYVRCGRGPEIWSGRRLAEGVQDGPVVLVQGVLGQRGEQVGTAQEGPLQRLVAPPPVDRAVVAGSEH